MTSALAMHDHLLRQLLHQHCGYEVRVDSVPVRHTLALRICIMCSEPQS